MKSDNLYSLWRNPSHWDRYGSYRCADDPRLFVNKLNGFGWTLNMAHPRAQVTIWLLLLVVVAFVLAVGFWARFRVTA